ncbi:hypothetical protein PFISCL1PPCAC_10620, partial [Pristionchus fissidentatus]
GKSLVSLSLSSLRWSELAVEKGREQPWSDSRLSSMSPLLLFLLSLSSSFAFSPFPPSEGDVRHLYPQSSISILLQSHSHVLPYLLGWIENIDYPKKRLHLNIYLSPEAKEDTTREQIQWWKGQISSFFKSLSIHETSKLEGKSWQEHALVNARQLLSSFVLFWNGDDLPSNDRFLSRIFNKSRPLVSSLLLPPSSHLGRWNIKLNTQLINNNIDSNAKMDEIGIVEYPFILNLDLSDSTYLTFEKGNVRGYDGIDSPLSVFSFSARVMSIPLLVDRSISIGWHIDQSFPLEERRMMLCYLLSQLVVDHSSIPLPQSRSVRAPRPQKKKFGFEKIYVINLRRRPERRAIMQTICDVIALECEFLDATDGRSLPSSYTVTQLDSFIDPSTKRKMTNGEVGCFLSHYRIWEEVSSLGLSRVLVLEDDARIIDGAFKMINEMMEDIVKTRTNWGLIYMGRKRTKEHIKSDMWVEGIRHLSTVGYSYWTVGYALSLEGAKTLLGGNPLERMVPVDEYLPIMADVHPNEEWKQAFKSRSLSMFSIHPLVIYPHRYTNEEGHVSDTEDSQIHEKKRDEL